MTKKIREADLEQTRRAVAYLQEKVWQQRAKMTISVLVKWIIVDCDLTVRVL